MLWHSIDWKPLAKRVPIIAGWVTISIETVIFLNLSFHQEWLARDNEFGEGGMRSMHSISPPMMPGWIAGPSYDARVHFSSS